MVAYTRDEIISVSDLARNLSTSLSSLLDYTRDKLAISKNNKLEAVIIPIEEYERMREAYEYVENMEIARIIEERSKTPKEDYLTLEELAQKRGINLDEL
jgi:PHD/YefM family antitoxin component YafN of YafNO toxin-antitoxin module